MRISNQAAEERFKALMVAAVAGDGAAYRMLLTELAPHLRAYFARRLARGPDAEDLVQETLIAIHTRKLSYDSSQPFTAWLHAIARYKLIDHFRRSGARPTVALENADSVTDESSLQASEAARDVEKLLAALPESRRALLRTVKLEGRSTAEAAAAHGLSESAVKVGIHRALKALSKLTGGKP
jgi:RNA polymerase sigma-70 factor (ECF subfamily)